MSTPMDRIEQYAEELALNTSLLVNKLNAAAIVAVQFRPRTGEEKFIETARVAYRSALEQIDASKADYLKNMGVPSRKEEPQP